MVWSPRVLGTTNGFRRAGPNNDVVRVVVHVLRRAPCRGPRVWVLCNITLRFMLLRDSAPTTIHVRDAPLAANTTANSTTSLERLAPTMARPWLEPGAKFPFFFIHSRDWCLIRLHNFRDTLLLLVGLAKLHRDIHLH